MRNVVRLASWCAALLLVNPASAQPPGGFGGFGRNPAMLLGQESVRKELKLTDDQIKKVEELSAKMREKFQEIFQGGAPDDEGRKKMQELMKENEKAVNDILKPEQTKRLKQISYQLAGAGAFADPEVAKTLQITDAQKADIQKINQESFEQMREFFQGGPPDDETRKKIQEIRKAAADKIVNLLTAEQKTQWKELQGEPFKGEIRFGPPRGN